MDQNCDCIVCVLRTRLRNEDQENRDTQPPAAAPDAEMRHMREELAKMWRDAPVYGAWEGLI